jgi:enoyl-CoA hydratase/carnithine racemase
MSDEQWNAQHYVFERMIRAIVDCPVPVVAAVNGAASAAEVRARARLRLRLCVAERPIALTEVTLGIMPGAGGTQNLPRAVGSRQARS